MSTPIADRYRDPELAHLAVTSDVIEQQLRHRSVRAFAPGEVSDAQLTAIVAAASSAPTSSNLQSWSVVAVRDEERKAVLAGLAGEQAFIEAAPLFLLWVADVGRARRLAERNGRTLDGTDYLEATLLAVIDAALAAQNAIVAAESLGLGTVCVGAARNHPEEIAAEIGLPSGSFVVFGLAVGVPDPAERAGVKPRLPQAAVLHHETYDVTADEELQSYDERLAAYNREVGLRGAWTERVLVRLADRTALKGRDVLRDQLEKLGLPSR